ncbi:sialidase family protein [Prevotella sp. S7 MS 2]|uniref:sialidase family protein n=1 Tax=Prevotella sp. S7 MS 2 TaxID=1287488 RepID=UPI000513CBC4|nr:sialidase family protein [Prevotella sp. S7 MS 2]KGI60163.1 hypothetical protein HMPREF0671_07580 [Prevotella sp. S7 MS 2]
MRQFLLTVALSAVALCSQAGHFHQILFRTLPDSVPYRIPAIAQAQNGNIIAVADYRYCGSDIGYGAIDLHFRESSDQGKTWSAERKLADGTGDESSAGWNYAFGDCALVADRTSPRVLAIGVCGKTPYTKARRNNPNRVARFYSDDNGHTWNQGEEITEKIYRLFDKHKDGPVQSLFFGSGKIHQSRYVKVGRYYRLYAALCTLQGNFVVYSDDFGKSWKALGNTTQSPCPKGDEPKCDELPDGSVILSSRANGRLFNVYTFTNVKKGRGSWDVPMKSQSFDGIQNACNGEILVVKARRASDETDVWLALQSVPFGPQRRHVGFFYRELPTTHIGTAGLVTGWTRGLQVSQQLSAYSTMTQLIGGNIGFLWEEGPTTYNIAYEVLSISEITNGRYFTPTLTRNTY